MQNPLQLRLPTSEYRVLPYPTTSGSRRAKIATCFVRADQVPSVLEEWMEVNPRIPVRNKKDSLQGTVAKAMVATLLEEPEKFELKNQGMYILADDVEFEKGEGGAGVVTVTLADRARNGLVNGGHTFLAIREAAETREDPENQDKYPDPWNAHVRLHIMVGVDADLITDIAEGLNRSLQVDNPSLENLRGTFEGIKRHMTGKTGEDQIAYRQGDPGDVDILQVLTSLAVFDLENYPDRKTHPNGLFGHPKALLDAFTKDASKDDSVFGKIIPKVHEILALSDRIQQEALRPERGLGKLKVSNAKKANRARSPKHYGRPAHFIGGNIDGNLPLGWLYPMLAAFRADVSREAWKKGRFEWIVDPADLLVEVVDELVQIVKQEHADNNKKPAEVGRKEAAYRGCYSVVTMELAQRGHVVS